MIAPVASWARKSAPPRIATTSRDTIKPGSKHFFIKIFPPCDPSLRVLTFCLIPPQSVFANQQFSAKEKWRRPVSGSATIWNSSLPYQSICAGKNSAIRSS
jgi:hypothetical protein